MHWQLEPGLNKELKHNEHQIEQAEEMAKRLGFSCFRHKVTKRMEKFPVEWLSLPSGHKSSTPIQTSLIKCHALEEKSMYIAADLTCLPCCFMGGEIFQPNSSIFSILPNKQINLRHNSIQNIIKRFNVVAETWSGSPFSKCSQTCSILPNISKTQFENQWKEGVV
jgi:hypothetical protein